MNFDYKKIENMREGGHILAEIFNILLDKIQVGIDKIEIENEAKNLCKKFGVIPNFLGYLGYPAATCIMVNDEVMHTIPRSYVFKENDVVSLDMGILYNNYHLDRARTKLLGNDSKRQRVIDVSAEALNIAINMSKNGVRVGDLGYAIQNYVESKGCSIVKELAGHTIGENLHMDPIIPNFGFKGKGKMLKYGHTMALEVIISAGSGDIVFEDDGWGIKTVDGSIAVTTEDTILVSQKCGEVLTI